MSCRRPESAAVALLSSAAASSTARIASRRLNGCCCSWRRNLSTPSLAAARLATTTRQRRPALARSSYSYNHLQSLNGRRTVVTEAKDASIAVLGGGLTGLTTAYYLAKKLPSTTKITLYESSDRLGGWIRTDRVPVDVGGKQGIVSFERGARSLTSLAQNTFRYDDLVLYDLVLDLGLNPVSPGAKPRYIYYPDHLVSLPPFFSTLDLFREPLFLQTIGAGIVLGINSLRRSHQAPLEDESVSDWLYSITNSRKGVGTLASAMMHGIYGGDIDKLSARCVLDRIYWGWYLPDPGLGRRAMPMLEQDILESLGKDEQIQKMTSMPKGALLDFGESGMEALPQALGAALRDQPNVTIKTSERVRRLSYDQTNKRVKITGSKSRELPQSFDKVISTLSGQDLARLTQDKLPSLAAMRSASIMTVNLWFPQENLKPPGFGYLIPNTVDPELNPEHALGVFFDSDVQTRSKDEPAGTKLFVLMGGHYYDRPGVTPPTEEEAIVQARNVLERHLGIPRDAPCHAVSRLAKECIPQHDVGHHERLVSARRELNENFGGRLAVAGGSFNRIGAVASLRSGYDIATETQSGLDATGLGFLEHLGKFAVVPVNRIPVRSFSNLEHKVLEE
ncbi:protoporphyrinogen oxidase [Fusarium albosuccineum]|uniref:Protoporphyrinogen oxidase n=1 Tax=Fusarium albosuccineum TaxID=1237068 RepID=A0A8H4L8S4_9HYPO|nr:protoporphyrinogen oxidase [Fusarium albosuccineum]